MNQAYQEGLSYSASKSLRSFPWIEGPLYLAGFLREASGGGTDSYCLWGYQFPSETTQAPLLGHLEGDLAQRWPSGIRSCSFCEVTCDPGVARKKDALMSQNANSLGEEKWKWACSHRAWLQGNDTTWETQCPAMRLHPITGTFLCIWSKACLPRNGFASLTSWRGRSGPN